MRIFRVIPSLNVSLQAASKKSDFRQMIFRCRWKSCSSSSSSSVDIGSVVVVIVWELEEVDCVLFWLGIGLWWWRRRRPAVTVTSEKRPVENNLERPISYQELSFENFQENNACMLTMRHHHAYVNMESRGAHTSSNSYPPPDRRPTTASVSLREAVSPPHSIYYFLPHPPHLRWDYSTETA